MSEYQYYDFLTIDRPLNPSEMAALRSLSTRAEITSTRFQNEYNWGDLKGSPGTLVEKYFDAHVYFADWGTYRLMLRLPKESIGEETLSSYAIDDIFSFWYTDDHLILEWVRNDEEPDGDWAEPEGWMAQLIPIRAELERGDFRALYLGWLHGVNAGIVAEDEDEPPIPPGLNSLSAAQSSLIEFLGIEPDFLCAAALASPPPPDKLQSEHKMFEWVAGIPQERAGDYLLLLLQGKSRHAERLIRQDFSAYLHNHAPDEQGVSKWRKRSVAELLEEVERARAKRVEREARERMRQTEELRRKRMTYLTELARDFDRHWKRAHLLAERGIASTHKEACRLLVDLSEAYLLKKRQGEFSLEIARFREAHARRKALLKRLDEAGIK
jgi:hypothetical protein